MTETTSVNLRIDKDLKRQAEQLFSELGLNMTTAMNMFLRQSVREHAIPFKVTTVPSYEDIPAYKGGMKAADNTIEYIAERLRETEERAAKGKMKYYTADEIRSGLEVILNEKL